RAVADGIDQPGDPAGGAMHRARGRIAHNLFLRAGDFQPMRDIGPRIRFGKGPEMIAGGDSLGELSQVLAVEDADELGLADEDDLEKLLRGGLEVGEESNLLEHVRG